MTLSERILSHADLSIDTRRELGLPPRKIRTPFLIPRRRPMIYLSDTQTLYIFHDDVCEIHRPIPLSYIGDAHAVFNELWGPHPCTLVYEHGDHVKYTSMMSFQVHLKHITFKSGWIHPTRSGLSQ
jgi:hypothetical protein